MPIRYAYAPLWHDDPRSFGQDSEDVFGYSDIVSVVAGWELRDPKGSRLIGETGFRR
jgi:hypothetical protein